MLEGFAAYVAGMDSFNEERARQYADNVIKRFPHIFMLEIAEGVDAGDVEGLIKRQKNQGYPEFSVKAFDYSGDRKWRDLPEAERYYPLTFMHPLPAASRPVLGLDMGSHEQFSNRVRARFLLAATRRACRSDSLKVTMPM